MSSPKIVLSADIGTSSLKAGFVDIGAAASGRPRLLAFVREPYPPEISPELVEGRHVKLPCTEWESAFRRALAALFGKLPDAHIEAICISGNGPTLVPVQKNGSAALPLYWFGKTETPAGMKSFFLPHVLWFMHKYPAQYEQTAAFYSCQEWLATRLGAAPVTVLPTPAYTPYYWDEPQCAAAGGGIAGGKLLPFAPLASIIGKTSPEAERRFGLKQGIPIVAGGPDFVMALLGTATVKPGLVCDRAGSSEGINVCLAGSGGDGVAGKNPQLRLLPHPIDGLWNVSVVLPESGSIFERWRDDNGFADKKYDELLAELIPDGARHFSSSFSNADVHPVLLQIAGQVKGAVDSLRAAGIPVSEMRLSGGQAKSPRWNKLKAAISNTVLLAPEILDGELTGNAAAAMLALGEAATLSEACINLVVINERYY
ncbi:MAG: sugar kinase [Spirochaetaceae bacterium]|jgi:sugar (pentulose or hexulose) kinase|nr:sugar kinase [Spirochaetaceae bacterium]